MTETMPAVSPGVRLHISIRDRKTDDYTEILRGSTKGYEIVEVDGLVFRRKRNAKESSPNTAKRSKILTPGNTSSSSPAGQSHSQALLEEQMAVEVTLPAAVSEDCGNIIVSPQADLELPSSAASRKAPAPLERDAEATAKLLLESLAGTEGEADRLLAACNLIPQVLGPQVNELAAALRSSVAEALEDSTLVCDVPQAPDTSKLRQVEQEMKQLVTLQKQLESMQQEEIEWSAILEQGRILSSSGLQLNLEQAQMQPIAESISMLKHTQSDTHSALTFQVEGLAMMMSNVEQLLHRAESQCRHMQVEYHKEKFMRYPHIDSPARLIQEIVKERHL